MTRHSTWKPLFLSLVLAAVLSPAPSVGAQSSDADARKHFDAGESYFKTSDYEGALREFQMAHRLSKRPLILLSIAAVHERMGRLQETIDSLKQYLVEEPQTKERATIELRIENLQKRIDEQKATAPAPTASSEPPPVVTEPPPVASTAVPPPTAPPPPLAGPNRTPAYISWGIGGAAVVGAVVTGLVAKGKYDDADAGCAKTPTGCSDDEVQPIKSMALVSTILTGVAVVGAGVGTWLFLSAKPAPTEAASIVPRLSAGASPKGANVGASWSF